jgi:DNA-damage-inducible protein J
MAGTLRFLQTVMGISLDFLPRLGYSVARIGVFTMSENSVVRARIDEATKSEAAAVLATMGLSLSDAFRMLLKRVAAEKALPFEPLVPNAETVEAMRAARRGELVAVGSLDGLLRDLNADD